MLNEPIRFEEIVIFIISKVIENIIIPIVEEMFTNTYLASQKFKLEPIFDIVHIMVQTCTIDICQD